MCFSSSALHQRAAGEPDPEGQVAGDGAAPQPEQSGAGAAAAGAWQLTL